MASGAAEAVGGWVDPDDIMAVTAQSSGQTLDSGRLAAAAPDPMSAAAAAALRRNQAALPSPGEMAAGSRVQDPAVVESGVEGLGHRDRQTEQLERAMRRLGSADIDTVMPDGVADVGAHSTGGNEAATVQLAEQGTLEQQSLQESMAAEHVSPAAVDHAAAADSIPVRQPGVSAEGSSGGAAADLPQEPAGGNVEPEMSGSDPMDTTSTEQRFRQAARAVHDLKAAATSQEEAATALQALQTILRNALTAPQDDRYRRLRPRNAAFVRRLGRFPQALEVLHVAGFQDAAIGNDDPVLALQRTDPGLLWLALEAVQTAMASG